MPKLAFVGGAFIALALVLGIPARGGSQTPPPAAPKDTALASTLTASQRARLPGPRQPIFFRHDIHAGQFEIPCQYCHYSVAVATEPGIPSLQTCMGCHLVVSGTDSVSKAEVAKLRKAWSDKQPIEWTRIHALPKHAHFPHMRHLKAMGPNACGTCHGEVTRMPQIYQVNKVNSMGFCVTCHLERNINRDCSACHY